MQHLSRVFRGILFVNCFLLIVTLYIIQIYECRIKKEHSHTFLIDNHVRLHSSQNASYTEDVCDMHLRLTAKPHLCVICSTFHT